MIKQNSVSENKLLNIHTTLLKTYPKLRKRIIRMWEAGERKTTIDKMLKQSYPKLTAKVLNYLQKFSWTKIFAPEFYTIIYGIKRPVCKECANLCGFDLGLRRYREFCSTECAMKSLDTQRRRNDTIKKLYGAENAFASPIIKEKIKKKLKAKYGVEYISQSPKIKEKMRKNALAKYGVDHHMKDPNVKERHKQNFREKYGVDNPMHVEEFVNKFNETIFEKYGVCNINAIPGVQQKKLKAYIATCLEKYGVRNAIQNPKILDYWHTQIANEETLNICGKSVNVMGFEKFALEKLYELKPFVAITTTPSKVGIIRYKYKGKSYKYIPDAKLKTKDGNIVVVEVKSWYTVDSKRVGYKIKAAIKHYNKLGIHFCLILADKQSNYIKVLYNPKNSDVDLLARLGSLFNSGNRFWKNS